LKGRPPAGDGVLHTWVGPESFELLRQTMRSIMDGAPDADVLNREAGFGAGSNFRFEHADPAGLNAGLQHLLLLCWRCQRGGQASGRAVALHPAVAKALALLSESTGGLDLGRLAVRCGASATHLSRMFARQVGVPLSGYRNAVRLERFFRTYREGAQRTIAEAAYAAGFGSYAQFHRVFTQSCGGGPRQRLADP
jgi:methylphosphotriester-DNA--protein-cysteine methyltransferase